MIKIKGKGLRMLKVLHLLGIICWLGGSVTSLAMLTQLSSMTHADALLSTLGLLEMVDLYVIAAAAMFTVGIGLIYGFFSSWGFGKMRWILVKWLLSLGIIITGSCFYLPLLTQMGQLVRDLGIAAVADVGFQSSLHWIYVLFGCHLAAMILMVFLSVLRPWSQVKSKQP